MLTALLAEAAPLDLRILGRMLIQAAAVGAAAGILAAGFFWALAVGEELCLELLAGYTPLRAAGEMEGKIRHNVPFRPWLLVLLPAAGALFGSLLTRHVAPECEGAGEDAVISSFHEDTQRFGWRVIWVKPLATLVTLATGGAGGREGPIAQIGAAVGTTLASYFRLSERERRILLVAGSAAGVAAIFRTPLGASLLAVEVLYRDDFEADALVPSVLASVVAYSVFISLFGEATLFATAPDYPFIPSQLPLYGLLAVVVATAAAAYVRTLRGVERLARRLPAWSRAAVGGLVVGAMATTAVMLFSPGLGLGILGGGYGAAQVAIAGADWLPEGGGGVQVLLALAVAKLVASSCTIGTRASVGVFGPSLAIGALVGGAFGRLVQLVLDNPNIDPGAFALVGMGTFWGGVAHAPLAALIIVCEMCGSYDLLVPLMLAGGIAFVALRRFTLYPSQRKSQRDTEAHPKHPLRLLQQVTVGSVMVHGRPFVSFGPGVPMTKVIHDVAEQSWQSSFPIVDDHDKIIGLITPEALRILAAEHDIEPWTVAMDAMSPPVTARQDEDLRAVSERFVSHGLGELPVVDGEGRIVGMLDEAQIAKTYLQITRAPLTQD
ncbi:MAG: chloride channel protein [Deltaproteobacteria bacterium]|nr:chloride channel protein [Deltaproteobacteria bacterium]